MIKETLLKKMENLIGMSIFYKRSGKNELHSFGIHPEKGEVLYNAPELVNVLEQKADAQEIPVIYKIQEKVYFICVRCEEIYYMVGPISVEVLNYVEIHQLYKISGKKLADERHPVKMNPTRLLAFTSLFCEMLTGKDIKQEELISGNHLGKKEVVEKKEDLLQKEQDELEREAYHHTYLEERYVMDCIRNGDVESVRERTDSLMQKSGVLSENALNDQRYLAIVAVTMATREAIAGGVSPVDAYKLSDKLINQIDHFTKIEEMTEMSRTCTVQFAQLVAENKKKRAGSNYTEQCKDYIAQNYHHKIYLEDIAEAIGISQGHLARIFQRDTGMKIQEYMLQFRIERAANLLKYSEASLSEISDYVCFNSQSHFGSAFRKQMGMTPSQYRNEYKRREFRS